MSGNWRNCRAAIFGLTVLACLAVSGCFRGPVMLAQSSQHTVDLKYVEYPTGTALKVIATGLNAPSAMAFDNDGTLFIAESGIDGSEPRIYGWKPDGTFIDIYPKFGRLTVEEMITRFRIYGPVGGMVVYQGKLYITHRDRDGRGVITAMERDGSHQTIVADLPAQGDYGVTDLAVSQNGRLYFGVGTATNSGVVGPDNVWVKRSPDVCDQSYKDLVTRGARFDTPNPGSGLFQPDLLVTSPFQTLGQSNLTRIKKVANGKPNGAIYSVSASGGDLRVEAYGIHNPVGIGFNEYGRLYMTNRGIELRGTRPIINDPDVFARVISDTYYGWPDYTADCNPVTDARYQPPIDMIIRTGYREVSFVIDHEASGLLPPDRATLVAASFLSQSGAAKFDFAPGSGPFKDLRGSAIVALSGDRAPFSTSGKKLVGPVGFKVMRVDIDTRQLTDFLKNTKGGPASKVAPGRDAFERPVDVKFGPDGALYILDMGRLDMRDALPRVQSGSGRIFKLTAAEGMVGTH